MNSLFLSHAMINAQRQTERDCVSSGGRSSVFESCTPCLRAVLDGSGHGSRHTRVRRVDGSLGKRSARCSIGLRRLLSHAMFMFSQVCRLVVSGLLRIGAISGDAGHSPTCLRPGRERRLPKSLPEILVGDYPLSRQIAATTRMLACNVCMTARVTRNDHLAETGLCCI